MSGTCEQTTFTMNELFVIIIAILPYQGWFKEGTFSGDDGLSDPVQWFRNTNPFDIHYLYLCGITSSSICLYSTWPLRACVQIYIHHEQAFCNFDLPSMMLLSRRRILMSCWSGSMALQYQRYSFGKYGRPYGVGSKNFFNSSSVKSSMKTDHQQLHGDMSTHKQPLQNLTNRGASERPHTFNFFISSNPAE